MEYLANPPGRERTQCQILIFLIDYKAGPQGEEGPSVKYWFSFIEHKNTRKVFLSLSSPCGPYSKI